MELTAEWGLTWQHPSRLAIRMKTGSGVRYDTLAVKYINQIQDYYNQARHVKERQTEKAPMQHSD